MPDPRQPAPPLRPATLDASVPARTGQPAVPPLPGLRNRCKVNAADEAVVCERCGAEMFRMHAVWRCPACRFKTDCCGW
jgi:hypothetical protein